MIRIALLALALLAPVAVASSSALSITIVQNELWEKPQETIVFPAELRNSGATALRVAFEIASNPSGIAAHVPAPVTLAAGETKTLPIVVQTPFRNGYMNEEARIVYRALPDGAPSQEFEVTVHTKGAYVPGPQIFAVMLALGLAALAFRRASARP